ncbi:MAG: hypothetical protein RLZZ511_4080 [Cyanobacteriota bacterium]
MVKAAASPPPPPAPGTPLQKLIAQLSEAERIKFLQILQASGVDPADPYLNILASHAVIAESITTAPDKIATVINELSGTMLAQADRYLAQAKDAALKQTEAAIAQSVARLIKRSKDQQAFTSWLPIVLPLSIAVVSLLTIGVGSGYLFALFQRGPIAPGESVKLTQAEVAALKYWRSEEGQLAENIVKWNAGQIVACQKAQVELFKPGEEVVISGYGKVQSGACVLWVVPPSSRRFSK